MTTLERAAKSYADKHVQPSQRDIAAKAFMQGALWEISAWISQKRK